MQMSTPSSGGFTMSLSRVWKLYFSAVLLAVTQFGLRVLPTVVGAQNNTESQLTLELYPANQPPLRPNAYLRLPLGAVRPEGWLRDQLLTQKHGLTGHLDEFWLSDSVWKGGHSEETRDQLRGVAWSRSGLLLVKYVVVFISMLYFVV
jgi:hypothetical protein